MNTPATPTATAARASTGTNSRCPPEALPLPARQLHRMRRIEHHRAAGAAHHRQRAHVGDQVVVAEGEAALADHDVLVAGGARLVHHVLHFPGRQELALLDVDRLAGAATAWMKLVCRHRKAGVCSTSTTAATSANGVSSCTSVSTGTPNFLRTPSSTASPASMPGTAKARRRGAVGLVEGRLEDVVDAEACRQLDSAWPATCSTRSRLSMTQGPAIRKSGWSLPTCLPDSFMRRRPPATALRARSRAPR